MRFVVLAAALARTSVEPFPALTASIAAQPGSASGRCDLTVDGTHHDARIFLDHERFHVAVMGPMGQPRLVLRSDGMGLALQQGTEQWVDTDASATLAALDLPTLVDVAFLFWGRLPGRPIRGIVTLPDGRAWVDLHTGATSITSILDPHQGVVLLDVGPPGLPSIGSIARRGHPLSDTIRIDLAGLTHIHANCVWTIGPVPPEAFRLGAGPGVKSTPLATLGRHALAELAMLRTRRQR